MQRPAEQGAAVPREAAVDRALGLAPFVGALCGLAALLALARAVSSTLVALLVALETLHLLFMTVMWRRYRPAAPVEDAALPLLTVVIPAFNEGPMVERSIRSAVAADYPRDRLEVLVVDDGSRDDTYFHMARVLREQGEVVRVIRFRGNRGKRAALRAGFEAARGEVVVTIDSDSEIEPQTLRAMASALVRDPRAGAVAGWVRVLNRDTLLGRMLDVQFTLSFDFARSAQSAFGTVFVCPGALSAFRRAVILPHLEAWTNQRFLGRPVGHGEDQALTNIVLRAGYDTIYERAAVVWTLVPDRYRQLTRMLTRWDRSYLVEGFSFARFMLSRYRDRSRLLPVLGFIASAFRLVYVAVGLVGLPALLLQRPELVAKGALAGLAAAALASLYYVRVERSLRFLWGAAYAGYALAGLQWVLPYALLTVRDERWGTR